MARNGLAVLLGVPVLLMAFGDLRKVATPLGYWLAWGAWAVFVVAAVARGGLAPWKTPLPRWVAPGFVLLVAGMLLAGWANDDAQTLYQALKILFVAALFVVMHRLALHTDRRTFMGVLYCCLLLIMLVFFGSRILFGSAYDLGPRQGDIFAQPGVIWKSGLFFLPVFLADALVEPRHWVRAACSVAACVFLVLVDGSRTGLLLAVVIVVALGIVIASRRDWPLVRRAPWTAPLAVLLLAALLAADGGLVALQRSQARHGARVAQFDTQFDRTVGSLLETRLGRGDAPRLRLLRNGLAQSRQCLPLGCGFGSTAIDAGYGIRQNVHNAYVAALADFGVAGLLGMLGFIAAAAGTMRRAATDRARDPGQVYFILGVAGSALAYCAALMLNTFSSEMSEWGYLLLMLAFMQRVPELP